MAAAMIAAAKASFFMPTPLCERSSGPAASRARRVERVCALPRAADHLDSGGVRSVREFTEEAGDHEGGLLADVHGVVADLLEGACHDQHRHRPLACVHVVADLN